MVGRWAGMLLAWNLELACVLARLVADLHATRKPLACRRCGLLDFSAALPQCRTIAARFPGSASLDLCSLQLAGYWRGVSDWHGLGMLLA